MSEPRIPSENQYPEEVELSQDQELWELLGKTSDTPSNEFFSRNILRKIRLEGENNSDNRQSASWKKWLSLKLLLPGGLAATSAFLLLGPFASNNSQSSDLATDSVPQPPIAENTDSSPSLEDSLQAELILAAADSPSSFSDEEIASLLF